MASFIFPQAENYDVVVLGSGEAGKSLAWHFAKSGKRTAVIERRYIGGSCPNIACLPSKNIVHSAKVASYFRRAAEFGVSVQDWKVDMSGVRRRKRLMVDVLIQMHLDKYRDSGAELIMGAGKFVSAGTLEVTLNDGGSRVIHGDKVILSTGSRATIDPVPGLLAAQPLTHIEALELEVVPDHLLVLGGGYVGLELAQAFRRFGSRVTIIEQNNRLVHREDPDTSEAIHKLCEDEGIDVVVSARVAKVEGVSGQKIQLTTNAAVLEGSHLLVATGRTPNSEGIGLEIAGVEVTERGHIKVNDKLETSAPNVWAVGDCANSPHFTHIAYDDFRVIRDNLAGGQRVTTGRQVPYCMFTDPELARVGLSESEAKQQGIPYRLSRVTMAAVLRTRTLSETRGFMKALIDVDSDRLLGFTAFGVDVGELLPAVQITMSAGLPYTALREGIFTHPTIGEGLNVLFSAPPHAPQ